ncbi:MAG TPA: DMT family transporter [candidate division Zixibacteria bacterium]|nr:DMT family transporter [candidate division Zixibacteria bacterium]
MTRPTRAATPHHDGPDLVGAGLVVLAAACFGTLGPLSRFAGDAGVDSLTIVAWRAALGAALVGGFLALRAATGNGRWIRFRALPARDRWFILAAAAANTVLNLCAFIAFERITIALTLLVFYLYPAFVAVISTIWFGERLDTLRWAALGLSLVGMVLVVFQAPASGGLDLPGIGLAFAAGLMQVFYVLAARHGFAHVPGAQAGAMTMAGATVLYVLLAAALGNLAALARPLASGAALWPVVLAGTIGAGIPTVAYILGIRRLGPSRAAILATMEPVVGVLLAALLLAEQPTAVQLAGGVLIIGSGVILQFRPRAEVAEHEAVAGEGDA